MHIIDRDVIYICITLLKATLKNVLDNIKANNIEFKFRLANRREI